MSLSANRMSSFFPRATGNLRRKKEGIPLAEIDVLRHFRPMECLLFSSSHRESKTKKKKTFHWPKLTYYVTFGQWNDFFFPRATGNLKTKKKKTFHWPKLTYYVSFGQWSVFFFSSSHRESKTKKRRHSIGRN